MPRKDRTFTDKDILRLIRNNLSIKEQEAIVIAICHGIAVVEQEGELVVVPSSALRDALEEAGVIEFIIDIIMAILFKKL